MNNITHGVFMLYSGMLLLGVLMGASFLGILVFEGGLTLIVVGVSYIIDGLNNKKNKTN